jgi:DNA (cytosine-5)-methyltransferase 1
VPWLLIENVPFMLQLAQGEALEVIVSALEHLGYRWAYRVVDSRAFGLPQRRRRVYMLASLVGDPRNVLFADEAGQRAEPSKEAWRDAACGFYWTEGLRGLGWAFDAVPTLKGGSTVGIPSPPAIVLPDGRIVTPDVRDAERLQGFAADWTAPAEEVERPGYRWKLIGNAVTVDVAEWIGERLASPGEYDEILDLPMAQGRIWPSAGWNMGSGRMTCPRVSEWPFVRARPALADFLQYPVKPLSGRAAKGFYERASRGRLRFPPGFLDVVRGYCEEEGLPS